MLVYVLPGELSWYGMFILKVQELGDKQVRDFDGKEHLAAHNSSLQRKCCWTLALLQIALLIIIIMNSTELTLGTNLLY